MARLNLIAKDIREKRILDYLEENASDALVEKINNGVRITVDGKELLNVKALDGFLQYAASEAKKTVEKGSSSACIEDTVVFGWAVHYFEEDSIQGKLFNLDGTEYKKPAPKPSQTATSKTTPVKKETERQFSIFDLTQDKGAEQKPEQTETIPTPDEALDYNIDDDHDNDEEEVANEAYNVEEDDETELQIAAQQVQEVVQDYSKASPMYKKYMEVCRRYMGYIVAYRLGDFYEFFDKDAQKASDVLNLTLTSKNVGLPERIPMCGVPYHAAEMYAKKLSAKYNVVLYDNDKEFYLYEQGRKTDGNTGEVTVEQNTQDDELNRYLQYLQGLFPNLEVAL